MVRHRVRIRFRKQGDLRFLGHRDVARCFERWFRRAGWQLKMSEGFHPKPRMAFPSALAVGIAGSDEVMEIELTTESGLTEALLERLAQCAPPGLNVASVEALAPQAAKARVRSFCYEIPLPPARLEGLADRIRRLLSAASWPVQRPKRKTPVDLCPLLEELALCGDVLRMRLRVIGQDSVGPRDVLAALDLADLEAEGAYATRTAVELCA